VRFSAEMLGSPEHIDRIFQHILSEETEILEKGPHYYYVDIILRIMRHFLEYIVLPFSF